MPTRQRLGLLAGIALLACGAILLEIGLHRTYSALFGQHLALIVLPAALLGAGAGGVAVYLAPSLARPRTLFSRLGYLSLLAAVGAVAALLIIIHVKAPETLDRAAVARLAEMAVAAMLPFVFVGMALAAAFRCAPRDAGRLGFAAFGAAALTGPLAVLALRAGAPRVGLMVAIVDGLAGLAFYFAPRSPTAPGTPPHAPIRPPGAVVATLMLASCVLLAGDLGAPWLKIPGLRWAQLDKTEAQEWSVLGLLTVDRALGGNAVMRTDGTAGVPIFDAKTTPPLQPDELAYALQKESGPVLVVDAGGGRDVRVALKFTQKDVRVVEPSALVARGMLRDRYKKYSGDLYDKPEVDVDVDDARGWLRRTGLRFSNIVLPLADTQAPAALGALEAIPVERYTVEAFRDYIERLAPDGTLVVTRWDAEADRLLALAAAALRRVGEPRPAAHLYACAASHATTLVLRRTAYSLRDVQALRNHCRKNKLSEIFAPDLPHSELRRQLTTDAEPAAIASATDLTPPTDDRPFFGATVPPAELRATLRDLRVLQASHHALLVLGCLLAAMVAALALGLGVPVLARPVPRGGHLGPLHYFGVAGAALTLTLTALAARLPMLLGHPGHALATVMVAFLGFAAAGSLLATRVARARVVAAAGGRAQLAVAALAACAVGLDPLIQAALGLPFGGRLAVALALAAPLGMLLGALLPLGVTLLTMRAPDLIPWCLGAAALGAFAASVVAPLMAMTLGYSAVLLAAGVACLLAAATVPLPVRSPAADPAASSGR
jgi:spermidine synthase